MAKLGCRNLKPLKKKWPLHKKNSQFLRPPSFLQSKLNSLRAPNSRSSWPKIIKLTIVQTRFSKFQIALLRFYAILFAILGHFWGDPTKVSEPLKKVAFSQEEFANFEAPFVFEFLQSKANSLKAPNSRVVQFAAALAQTQVLLSAAGHHQHPLHKDVVLEVHAKHAAELRRSVEKGPVRGYWRDQAKLDGCFYAAVRGAIRGWVF